MSANAAIAVELTRYREGDEGFTSLCYQPGSASWISADSMGNLHTITSSSKSETNISELGQTAIALKTTMNTADDEVVLGDVDGSVSIRKMAKVDEVFKSDIVRFTVPVTALSYDSTGDHIFASAKEADINIYSKLSKSVVHKIRTSDKSGIKTFDLSMSGPYIAFVDENATVKIHSLKIQDGIYVGDERVGRFPEICSKPFCRKQEYGVRLSWHPTKPILAVPGLGGSVSVMVPSDAKTALLSSPSGNSSGAIAEWKDLFLTASEDGPSHGKSDLTVVKFSPNGNYLVSGDCDGVVLIWRMKHDAIDRSYPVKKIVTNSNSPICDVSFSPTNTSDADNYVIIATKDSYAYAYGIIDSELPISPTKPSKSPVKPAKNSNFKRLQKSKTDDKSDDENFDDGDSNMFMDNSATEDKAKPVAVAKANSSGTTQDENLDDDDDSMDDDDSIIVDDVAPRANTNGLGKIKGMLQSLLENGQYGKLELQKPFQPSSTSSKDGRNYLVWNNIGNIVAIADNLSTRIEIRFADTTQEKISFVDDHMYNKASLAKEGAIFATDPLYLDDVEKIGLDEDEILDKTRGSTIFYRAFSSKYLEGANYNFSYEMDRGEAAVCVAVGAGFCAVVTSKNLLRLFTSTGLQLIVTHIKGPVVSITASKSRLAIVYHLGSSVCVDIFEISWKVNSVSAILERQPLPYNTSKLEWLGFDVESLCLCSLDSNGILSMLVHAGSWFWTPVLDIHRVRKSADHLYWPIMVKNGKFIYVPLHGITKPSIYPEPTKATQTFDFSLLKVTSGIAKEGKVWAAKKNDKGVFANELYQSVYWESIKLKDQENFMNTSSTPVDVAQFDSQKIQLEKKLCDAIDMACVEKIPERAMDWIHCLKTEQGLNYAIAAGNRNNLPKVAELADVTKYNMLLQMQGNNEGYDETGYTDYDQQQQQQQQQHRSTPQKQQEDTPQQRSSFNSALTSSPSAGTRSKSRELDFDAPLMSQAQISYRQYGTQDLLAQSSNSIGSAEKAKPPNPFAVSSVLSPVKRKSGLDALQDMKGSPSPKKPLIRQSSFTLGAKSKKNENRNLL